MENAVLQVIFYVFLAGELFIIVYALTQFKQLKERLPLYVMAIVIGGVLFLAMTSANAQTEPEVSVSRADIIRERIKDADALCNTVSMSVTTEVDVPAKSKDGLPVKRITERPVALCAYGEESKTWHVIHVHLPNPVPKEYITCVRGAPTLEDRKACVLPYQVITPGYQLEHLRGYGIVRLTFNVFTEKVIRIQHGDETNELRMKDEKLTVYRTRHLWFDDAVLATGDVDRIVETATPINYAPYHPDFHDAEFVMDGAQFLFGKVRGAQRALGYDMSSPDTVRSHAFPDEALASMVPWETPMSLAIIEQMDDKTFLANRTNATEAVLIEYALNREDAFRWAQSGKDAIGPLQFTNSGGNGTYSAMVREYPEAKINPDFQLGARDIDNVLKAAIALIDKEVAQFPESKTLYKKNPKIGGSLPVASYNWGPIGARTLFAWLKKNKIDILREEVTLPQSFITKQVEKCPCRATATQKAKKKGTVTHYSHNSETPGYLAKYLWLLNYLADLGLD